MSDTPVSRKAAQEIFERCKSGSDCPMCQDIERSNDNKRRDDTDVIAELPSGRVHLKQDAVYRGYCILIFHRHAVELADLTSEERRLWVEDLARIGEAITSCCQPAKLNLSMLGNLVPHLHCHLMPRYLDDPAWGAPPSFVSDSHPQLSANDYVHLYQNLKNLLQ